MENIKALIHQNNVKVCICMAMLTAILGILGTIISHFLHWGLTGTGVFLIFSGIINFIAFYFSDRLVLRVSGAKPLERQQVPELFEIVDNLCQSISVPVPKLYLINTDAMNAFATGRDENHAAIAVTKGLLEKLDLEEVRGVVAHELSHVQNGDMRLMAMISIIAGFISIMADMYWQGVNVSRIGEKDRSGLLAIVGVLFSLFAPLTAMFIQLSISRRREFIADASATEMTRDPMGLAEALRKISLDHRPLPGVGSSTAHLYISNPVTTDGWVERLFSTHPPVEERIAALHSLSGRR